jgi:type IV pilus biogenesis protein CpaD/CtpE
MRNYKLRTLAVNASTLTLIALASASLTLLQGCSKARSQKPATVVQQQPQREVQVSPENKVTNESPIACNMAALSDEQRNRIMVLIKQIRAAGQEVRELADGYSFRLPAESAMIKDVSEWITLERLCCPFFRFEMEVEADGGALWVRLTGREGVKEFTKIELGL